MQSYYKSDSEFYQYMADLTENLSTDKASLFYKTNRPVSYVASELTLLQEQIPKMMFAISAANEGFGDSLTKHCADQGVDRKLAKYSSTILTITGRNKAKLPANSLVSTMDGLSFATTQEIIIGESGEAEVQAIAVKSGSKYNVPANSITVFPVTYSGIISVTNKEDVVNGFDKETDQELLERYLFKVRTIVTSGNKNHYVMWCTEVDGIGKCKVYETTDENGQHKPGHVLIIIADSNLRTPSEELRLKCYNHIEENRPVGANVHVLGATEVNIDIECKVYFDDSKYTLEDIKKEAELNIKEYFKEKSFSDENTTYISYNKINGIIANMKMIDDSNSLKINNSNVNITLNNTQIPILNSLILTEGE